RTERMVVVADFAVEAPKTKQLVAKLGDLGMKEVLIVASQPDENLYLAARNLYGVDVCDVREIDPVSLIGFDKVVITSESLKQLEESLS
ncbi:MAG: 50S ribosomal protein L4, partial [Sedimenticola sp.]|nr:50S ribosomal protein L4 [Sedimenticola sp.]